MGKVNFFMSIELEQIVIENGAKIGPYIVEAIIKSVPGHCCCLSRDPFVENEVVLDLFSLSAQERNEELECRLEELSQLDHPGLAPVFDSGFINDIFYLTSNYPHQYPVVQCLAEGLTALELMEILDQICDVLEYLSGQKILVGVPAVTDLYLPPGKRLIVANYGVISRLNSANEPAESLNEEQLLAGLAHLTACLIDSYDKKCNGLGRDTAIDFIAEGLGLQEGVAVTGFQEFRELVAQSLPAVKEPLPEEPSGIADFEDQGKIDLQQRSLLLPHVRQLLEQQIQLKQKATSLLRDKNQVESRLAVALEQVDDLSQRLLFSQDQLVATTARRRYLMYGLTALIGIMVAGLGWVLPQMSTGQLMAQQSAAELTPVSSAELKPVSSIIQEDIETPAFKNHVLVADILKTNKMSLLSQGLPTLDTPDIKHGWPSEAEFDTDAPLLFATDKTDEMLSISVELGSTIANLVLDWAQAWSAQQVSDYLAYYSADFSPENGNSREQWNQLRNRRLLEPSSIQVLINNIHIDRSIDQRLRVTFIQDYQSDRYQSQVTKALELVEEPDGWKIIAEQKLPASRQL